MKNSNTLGTVDVSKKESLFAIGEHFYALESLLIENEGEIDEHIDQWLEEYEAKESDKIDAYCYIIQKFEDIAAEAKRLAERSMTYSKKARSLKERLKFYLENRGKDKLETNRFTLRICGNGGLLPVQLNEGIEPEELPDQFVRIYREADYSTLREAIEKGDKVALQFAKVLPRGTHLRIK